jgi:hypothetical protein
VLKTTHWLRQIRHESGAAKQRRFALENGGFQARWRFSVQAAIPDYAIPFGALSTRFYCKRVSKGHAQRNLAGYTMIEGHR